MPFDLLCCVRGAGGAGGGARRGAEVRELDHSHRSLGEVPSDVFVFERTLESLLCRGNRITELPRQLFMCHGLQHLDLADNELQALPAAISSLVNLRRLDLAKNALASLPETVKSLKHLTFLDLSVNPLEKLPEAVTNLIALQELYLNDAYLEYLPGNFGRLANLRILELRDNYLMILPKSLARATELTRLDLGQNEFQQLPEVIGKFTKLRELWIDCNSLTGIPALIKPLASLVHLEASNNMIEEISSDISYCTELVDLSLTSNNLTQLPEGIGNLSKLTTLKLDSNKLYELPESLGQMGDLEELMLMTNYLDRIPSSVGLLRKLQYLNLDENMLRSIPPEIGSCTKLSVLSLRCNKLTSIPPEIGHLTSLRVLNLVRNSLSCLPQSLLNCDNLVALWLSENQSKPLVPMHSEVDPHTYQQVLTCFLFPQVPLSPIESKLEVDKNASQDTPNASRHISFVDMKAVPKVAEKPGQLRRAPTPYPKELRALAKHARNVHKDGSNDIAPPMQSAVHIKAAKITPTLQQRFASDHRNELDESKELLDGPNDLKENVPNYENRNDNPYDRPLDLNYRQEKSYQSVDHALYSETNDSAYGGFKDSEPAAHDMEVSYHDRPCEIHAPRKDVVDVVAPTSSLNVYGHPTFSDNVRHSNESYLRDGTHIQNNFQRLSVASQDRIPTNGSALRHHMETSYSQTPLIDNRVPYDQITAGVRDDHYRPNSDSNYHGSVYDSESYAHAKEKIYARRRYDAYKYHAHGLRNMPSPRVPTVSQAVSGSTTMPNLREFDNVYPGPSGEGHYFSGPDLQAVSPNANVYALSNSSPTYLVSQSPDLYSPTGHNSMTNPYRMANTPLVSEDGSYSRLQSPLSQNVYNIYEATPVNSNPGSVAGHQHSPGSVQSDPVYGRGQPPPYHVAAPYTKQAQYFNGTG